MLLQFTVENVLSFRDETVLSLLAAPGVEHAPGQVIDVPGLAQPVLRVVALYGANASGKSNLVKAMAMARRLVLEGTRPDMRIEVAPFKLDPEAWGKRTAAAVRAYSPGRCGTADRLERADPSGASSHRESRREGFCNPD